MTLASTAPNTWTQSQIQAIAASEIPSIVPKFVQLSATQRSWFTATQLCALLTSQGVGVLSGAWGSLPADFNIDSLSEAVAQQSVNYLRQVAWPQAVQYQPNLIAKVIPRLSIDRLVDVNWFSCTGGSYQFMSYLTAPQLSQLLYWDGIGILCGAWLTSETNNAVRYVNANALAIALAAMSDDFLTNITLNQLDYMAARQPGFASK